jgi:hypothetical protein
LDPATGLATGRYFFDRGGAPFEAAVTCLRVEGGRAVVGGRITSGAPGSSGFLVWIEDGDASPGVAGIDMITTTPLSPDDPDWPAGIADVPMTCPGLDPPTNVPWRSIEGTVTVVDR